MTDNEGRIVFTERLFRRRMGTHPGLERRPLAFKRSLLTIQYRADRSLAKSGLFPTVSLLTTWSHS